MRKIEPKRPVTVPLSKMILSIICDPFDIIYISNTFLRAFSASILKKYLIFSTSFRYFSILKNYKICTNIVYNCTSFSCWLYSHCLLYKNFYVIFISVSKSWTASRALSFAPRVLNRGRRRINWFAPLAAIIAARTRQEGELYSSNRKKKLCQGVLMAMIYERTAWICTRHESLESNREIVTRTSISGVLRSAMLLSIICMFIIRGHDL